jgi:hypothetical protein
MYESINKEKLMNMLARESNETSNCKTLNEYELQLKEIRKILIQDLTNREEFIKELSGLIKKDKDEYFNFLDNEVRK